jgi:hypothetical protein
MIRTGMTGEKPPTYRVYLILREGRRSFWEESCNASVVEDGPDLKIYARQIPVSGFDGHILLRRVDADPEPLPPVPDDGYDESDEDALPYLGAPRRG